MDHQTQLAAFLCSRIIPFIGELGCCLKFPFLYLLFGYGEKFYSDAGCMTLIPKWAVCLEIFTMSSTSDRRKRVLIAYTHMRPPPTSWKLEFSRCSSEGTMLSLQLQPSCAPPTSLTLLPHGNMVPAPGVTGKKEYRVANRHAFCNHIRFNLNYYFFLFSDLFRKHKCLKHELF